MQKLGIFLLCLTVLLGSLILNKSHVLGEKNVANTELTDQNSTETSENPPENPLENPSEDNQSKYEVYYHTDTHANHDQHAKSSRQLTNFFQNSFYQFNFIQEILKPPLS